MGTTYEYQVGGSLPTNSPTYVQRKADQDLYEGLQAGEFCYILNSRQMGKSSLRVQTMKQLQAEGVACVAVDITSIGTADITPEQWYAGIIDTVSSNFHLDSHFDLETWWEENGLLSPVQKFGKFLETVLLQFVPSPIVIFIDEIDSVLSLPFDIDDFFAVIRDCFNNRANKPDFQRLTFVLLGVATPADLIQDKRRTPFNIGRAIELTGFQLAESPPLMGGLREYCADPYPVMKAILDWTGGQPFLTQRLCRLIRATGAFIPTGQETEWVQTLVGEKVLESWEAQDSPEHLKTIRDRILRSSSQRTGRLLGLYQQVLHQGKVAADDSPEQMELRLSGLVVRREGCLQVYNRIYERVFTEEWVERELSRLRPYAEALSGWVKSGGRDTSRLLRGQALEDAQLWATGKSLTDQDYRFLDASRELEQQETERDLEAQRQANQILADARHKAEQSLAEEKQANERLTAAQQELIATQQETEILLVKGRRIRRITSWVAIVTTGLAVGATLWAAKGLQEVQKLRQAVNRSELRIGLADVKLKASEANEHYISGEKFVSLLEALSAVQDLRQLKPRLASLERDSQLLYKGIQLQVAVILQDAVYGVREQNRLRDSFSGKVKSASFSPDGQKILSTYDNGEAIVWSKAGNSLLTLTDPDIQIESAFFSPDGSLIATADEDGTAALWNRQGKPFKKLKGHQNQLWSVSFSLDGTLIATASEDQTAKLWNRQGQLLTTLSGHQGGVYSASFSPDSQTIATASADGTVKLWNRSGKELRTLKSRHGKAWNVTFSPDGKTIATAYQDGTVKLWDREGGERKTWKAHQGQVYSVSFSSNGIQMATASSDGKVKIWNREGQEIMTFTGFQGEVYSANFSPDQKTIVTAAENGIVQLWSLQEPALKPLLGHRDSLTDVNFSPDGTQILTASLDGTAKLWNRKGQELQTLKGNQGPLASAEFSPDGQTIATGGEDGTVKLWNLQGQILKAFKAHDLAVAGISFSPDGNTLATASWDRTAKLWNRSGQELKKLEGHDDAVLAVKFSPDGTTIATASADSTARLWNREGKSIALLKGHDAPVVNVNFSPDGRFIVTASWDQTAKLWNQEGKVVKTFQGHQGIVYDAQFSPDGLIIATASADRTAKLWNREGFQEPKGKARLPLSRPEMGIYLSTLRGHQDRIVRVSFSPDGQTLLTASHDKTVKQWNLNLNELITLSCDWLKPYLLLNPDLQREYTICPLGVKNQAKGE